MQTLKPTVVTSVCGIWTVSEAEAESPGSGTRSDVGRRPSTLTATVVAVDEVIGVDERASRRLRGNSTSHPHNNTFNTLRLYS